MTAPWNQAEPTCSRFVRKLAGFVTLSAQDRVALEGLTRDIRYLPPSTDLIREGDPPNGIFLVLEGMACRHKVQSRGHRQIVAYLLPGDAGDLDAPLLDRMDHTISTLSACTIARLDPLALGETIGQHPAIGHALRMCALVDAATLREWLVNVGSRSGASRLAHLFCELLVRFQAVGLAEDGCYVLPLTQKDLADTVGLSNVHVNRTLQELRQRGLIELRGKRLRILDLAQLRLLAGFRDNYLHLGEARIDQTAG